MSWSCPRTGVSCILSLFAAMAGTILAAAVPGTAAGGEITWVEDFADDPLIAGRFSLRPPNAAERFTYDAGQGLLTGHYDSFEPTVWYMRPLDAVHGHAFGRYDQFEFSVTFRIRSEGFYADPDMFAQIGWGLVNAQTTGPDRAGCDNEASKAFDCASFDFFPNVSPIYGGPTLGPTVIHSDRGSDNYYSSIDFPFYQESTISIPHGDETILLDVVYTAYVMYDPIQQVATLTLYQDGRPLAINTEGAGGVGGPDGDITTIQRFLTIDRGFAVDSFALLLWRDSCNYGWSSVIADVDFLQISFDGHFWGDMNLDGAVDGLDVGLFAQTMLAPNPDPDMVGRGDFNGDGALNCEDLAIFAEALLQR